MSQIWAITLELSANPSKTSLYQRVLLTIKVTDGKLKSPPDIKGVKDFDVSSTGTSTSFSFINGTSSSSTTYSYVLSSSKLGTYYIHAEGEDKAGKIISNTAEVIIEEKQQAQDGLDEIFIRVELSTNEGYIHQQLNYKFKLYTAYRIQETKLTLPKFEGFWVEDAGKEKQYQETINGQQYLVYEINKALFPQQTGTFELKAARVFCRVLTQRTQNNNSFGQFSGNPFFNDPFFSNPFANTQLIDKMIIAPQATQLRIKPLPENPEAIKSELVGNFHISVAVSETELKAGESTTLTVQVSGDSNVSLLELPGINIPHLKTYKDKPVITQALHGDKIIFTKEFKVAIIPESPGEITLPTIEIPYFSTFEDKWLTMRGKDIILSVSKGFQRNVPKEELMPPSEAQVTKPKKIDIVGKDILPAYIHDELFIDDNIKGYIQKIYLISGILFIVFIILIAYYYRFFRPRFNVSFLRYSNAAAKASKVISHSTKREELSLALRQFIGDKVEKSGSALGREEINDILTKSATSPEFTSEFLDLYDELETALYGGGQINQSGFNMLQTRSETIIQKLNKTL